MMMLDHIYSQVEEGVKESYAKGVKDERERIISILCFLKRDANFRRGGSYCKKEYLQKENYVIEIISEILDNL